MKKKMKKLSKYCFLIILLSWNLNNVFAQLDSCILISGEDYQGTLFQENYNIDISPDKSGKLLKKPIEYININEIKKWTPTTKEIVDFEQSLFSILGNYRPKNDYQKSNIDYILKELANYNRQYIGFIDSLSNKCLYINFYKSKEKLIVPDNNVRMVLGGGANYFSLWFNLTEKKVIELIINGPI
ncbi:hypothetical protein ACE01N_20395 [Saccharicrinis sp. FJH2]|uniref:hypothetical protein n=1 Tax=Saccharicrinis sp. FJH65 TaxID=3344659 RepID=UPI0035F36BF8